MNSHIFKTTTIIVLTSNYLIASSCSTGFCGVTLPHIPSDIEKNTQLKPFNFSNKEQTEKTYNGWFLVDNGGDNAIGENRLMSGVDFNSFFGDGDKLSLFGLITSENLKSGKVSYAYPLSWNNAIAEVSYIHTNYTLGVPFPNATGIGTTRSIEGKIIYPIINSENEKSNFSLSFNNNNIEDEITNDSIVTNSEKASYSATAHIDFKTTNHKFSLGITSGYLSFDNINDEKIDKLTFDTKGSYTKINVDYKNTISLSENISLKSSFRSQHALNNKNLDNSESISVGGTSGVKVYEESSVFASNGFVANIEVKYKLAEYHGIKNSIGTFYDYGKIWESDNLIPSTEKISVQDTGVGIYTNYKKFFSIAQIAIELGNSDISAKDDENYRVIFQAGFVF